jgi:hypothetical protein
LLQEVQKERCALQKMPKAVNVSFYFLHLDMRLILLSVLVCIASFVQSQRFTDSTWALSTVFQYHPYDFFVGVGMQKSVSKHRFGAQFYSGVNRTFFQQRFYPKLDIQYGFDLFEKTIIHVIPELHLAGSLLNISADDKQIACYIETTAGMTLGVGRINQWLLNVQFGPMWSKYEANHSNLSWNLLYEIRYVHRIN